MTKYKLITHAPTTYQRQSLHHFGLPTKAYGNGAYYSSKIFDSEEEAKEYLIERAENYYDGHVDNNDEKLKEAIERIKEYGSVYLDAGYGKIEEIEVDEDGNEDTF